VALAVLATGTRAADLGGRRVAVPTETLLPAFDWTGFYLGAHAGFGSGDHRFDRSLDVALASHRYRGALFGGQFGWNYQINRFVLGLEGTLAWADLAGSSPYQDGAARLGTRVTSIATMGPRLGFAIDRALIYGKGGLAFVGYRSLISGLPDPVAPASGARAGWFLGAGLEYALTPNWTARIEYNYVNTGTGAWLVAAGPGLTGYRSRQDIQTVTFGLNYLFPTATRVSAERQPTSPAGLWTGFYAGLHAGYGTGDTTFSPSFGVVVSPHRSQGGLIGAQFGWNQQFDQVVVGIEGSLAFANLAGSATDPVMGVFGSKAARIATMGPRLGFAIDRALLYGKGGFAAGSFDNRYEVAGLSRASSAKSLGWFVGGGAEYAFAPNWSAKVEYNYIAMGTGFFTVSDPAQPHTGGFQSNRNVHTVTLGVNYLFNTGPSRVVARN